MRKALKDKGVLEGTLEVPHFFNSLAGIQIKATDYAQQYFPCKSAEKGYICDISLFSIW